MLKSLGASSVTKWPNRSACLGQINRYAWRVRHVQLLKHYTQLTTPQESLGCLDEAKALVERVGTWIVTRSQLQERSRDCRITITPAKAPVHEHISTEDLTSLQAHAAYRLTSTKQSMRMCST